MGPERESEDQDIRIYFKTVHNHIRAFDPEAKFALPDDSPHWDKLTGSKEATFWGGVALVLLNWGVRTSGRSAICHPDTTIPVESTSAAKSFEYPLELASRHKGWEFWLGYAKGQGPCARWRIHCWCTDERGRIVEPLGRCKEYFGANMSPGAFESQLRQLFAIEDMMDDDAAGTA